MNKAQTRFNGILFILGILIVICIIVILAIVINPDITGNFVRAFQNCRDVQVPYEKQVTDSKTVQYTEQECESKNLIYSATNEKWDYSTCNKQSEVCYEKHWYGDSDCHTFCSDKSLSYSVNINNLDEEQGSWKVSIYFYKQGTLYKTIPITQFLYPKTTKTFTGAFSVTGDSPAGDANQEYSAGYNIQYIPTKQICRDVIKYKEVPETKTIIEYKTEEKCD